MEMEDPKETHIQIEDEHIDSKHNNTTVRTHTSHIVKMKVFLKHSHSLFTRTRGRVTIGSRISITKKKKSHAMPFQTEHLIYVVAMIIRLDVFMYFHPVV